MPLPKARVGWVVIRDEVRRVMVTKLAPQNSSCSPISEDGPFWYCYELGYCVKERTEKDEYIVSEIFDHKSDAIKSLIKSLPLRISRVEEHIEEERLYWAYLKDHLNYCIEHEK